MAADLDQVLDRSVLRVLGQEDRRRLVAASRREKIPAQGVVLSEGQPAAHVFLLLSGAIRVFHVAPSGLELVLMFCRAPALFGEIEALLGVPHIENVSAMEDAELLLVPNAIFLELLERHLGLARAMVWDVTAKLAMASHNQKALAFQAIPTRLATLLVTYAAFSGKRMLDGIEIKLSVTQDDMAQALGITRRAVSKVITAWLDEGLLSRRGGRYVLHRVERLAKLGAVEHIGLTYDHQTGLTILSPEGAAAPTWVPLKPEP